MDETASRQFEDQLVSQTTTYLDQIDECVGQLPGLLDQYAAHEPYQPTVDRIRALETVGDETHRHISALISNASVEDLGIRLPQVHFNAGPTITVYQHFDEIANAAEQFAEELAAIAPPRVPKCFDPLREMADCAVQTMPALRRAVIGFIGSLCSPYQTITIAEEIHEIRMAESTCDGLRNEVIATAFDSDSSATPLIYRELAVRLDTILDRMEDVTDQLIWIAGNQSWIDVEPDGAPRP